MSELQTTIKINTAKLISLLAPLVFSFAVAQDIFVPEVPQLVGIFHTNVAVVQWTLSIFMLAVGAGQLLSGPLSDHFGRRRVIMLSQWIFILGSIAAALSPNIYMLILFRVFEGIGACGMFVGSFAVVRDVSVGDESAKLFSYLNGAIAVSPLLAPIIGGYLDVWFGWRAPFYALAVLGFLSFLAIFFGLKETQHPNNVIPVNAEIFKRYFHILRNKQFLVYSFSAAAALASFFTFFSVSSYILIEHLKVAETHFGYYFATIGIIFFFATLLAGKLCENIGIYRVVLMGALLLGISGIILLVWHFIWGLSILGFMTSSAIAAVGGAFLMGAGAGGALEPFGEMAGTAAAVLGAMQFLMATVVASIVLQWRITLDINLSITYLVMGCISLLGLIYLHSYLHKTKLEKHSIS